MKAYRLLFLGLLVCNCHKKEEVVFSDEVLNNANNVFCSSKLIKEDIDCVYPAKIASIDSFFIIQDLGSQECVKLYNSVGEYLSPFIQKGVAPNDVANLTSPFVVDKTTNIVSVYSQPFIYDFDFNLFIKGNESYCTKENCSKLLRFPIRNVRRIDESFLLEGFTEKFRFGVRTTRYDSLIISNEYPTIKSNANMEEIAAVYSYANKIALSPNGKSWVQSSYIGGMLSLFKLDNNSINNYSNVFLYPPIYEGKNSDITWGNETIIGFDDIIATDHYIYALLNGNRGAELKKESPDLPFGNRILIFDWAGNLIKCITTDCMMMAIDINEVDNMIYTVTYNGENGYEIRSIAI